MNHTPDPVAEAAHAALARAHAEVRLLACIAPIGRFGLALAGRAGVTLDHFESDDGFAIYAALLVADRLGRIHERDRTVGLIVTSLRLAGLWDAADLRPFAHGMRWGPGAVAALLTRVSRWDAERLVPILAADLLALARGEVCHVTA